MKLNIRNILSTLLAVTAIVAIQGRTVAQAVLNPCPEVLINEKYDHKNNRHYEAMGWDTATTCAHREMTLTSESYIPVQYFNGNYTVEEIPYAPADPTFALGKKMPITTDDDFSADSTVISFPFYFFGIKKTCFVLGANGLVTFNRASTDHACPWTYTAPLPWPDGTYGAPHLNSVPISMMRDAIYGIYEDTHPLASYLSGAQGIYYGIQDEYPCRKIICSWNGIPTFPGSQNLNNRCTYQIVCYEGSNIIEVHVKRRGVNTNWHNGVGLIGIQNATGMPQERDSVDPGASNFRVVNGTPAYFAPQGTNTFNDTMSMKAFRFTPQGTTQMSYFWVRIFPDGSRDTLTTNVEDTNGYYLPMDPSDTLHPTLTKAIINPTCTSKYLLVLNFMNAAGNWYHLSDSIVVGIDTLNDLRIKPVGATTQDMARHEFNICEGQTLDSKTVYGEYQYMDSVQWEVINTVDGTESVVPESRYELTNYDQLLRLSPGDEKLVDEDSIRLAVRMVFRNGCPNTDTMLIRIHPLYDTTEVHGICVGETFHWHVTDEDYTHTTNKPKKTLTSANGCDSVVHLDLTVYDVSHTVDYRNDCKPLTWLNGVTYYEDNTATSESDTVVLLNIYNCDSVVRLDFTIHPMTPLIQSSLTMFDFDNVDVVLTDVSTGGNYRRWILPGGRVTTDSITYYSVTPDIDTALITLVELSPYGCRDTAKLLLPFNKERMWIPNAFTPYDGWSNQTFSTVSTDIIEEEMMIYNRNGLLVYHCKGVDCAWNGLNMNGEICPQGAYVYIVRYRSLHEPDVTKTRKGTVTLIR